MCEPNFSDVSVLKDELERWRRTYEYRGIKYDIILLQDDYSHWYDVENPRETDCIAGLARYFGARSNFLYHTNDDGSDKEMFYASLTNAKCDIDWFLDDYIDEINERINLLKGVCCEVEEIVKELKKAVMVCEYCKKTYKQHEEER